MDLGDMVNKIVISEAAGVEAALMALPAGYRLCRHGVRVTSDPAAWDDDVLVLRFSEHVHRLAPGERCHVPRREEIAP